MSAPEWLYEAGIGEARAALVVDGQIVEAAIELAGTLAVGTIAQGRVAELLPLGKAVVALGDVEVLTRLPPGATLGGTATVEITREAIPEPGRPKRARAVPSEAEPCPGSDLRARLAGAPVRQLRSHEPDVLEAAGWSELLDEAMTGEIAFPGGALRLSPTPAMTLFDVDGSLAPEPLAIAGARAVAGAIRRHGIRGSIGIDFPTLGGKATRLAVATALDAAMPAPFERTAVNGFGFMQIVRPRPRASLPELLRADPVGAATRAALRQMERTPPGTPAHHRLPAAVLAQLAARPDWMAELARRTGAVPVLEPR